MPGSETCGVVTFSARRHEFLDPVKKLPANIFQLPVEEIGEETEINNAASIKYKQGHTTAHFFVPIISFCNP